MMSNLKEKYRSEIVAKLSEAGTYRNGHEVPKIAKLVINMGMNSSLDKDAMAQAAEELACISGQKPLITKARGSVSNFKLREGMPIGAKVTLRGNRMYDFLYRLINIALPRIRDFRGLSEKSFDGYGNYTLGIREQTIFPEIDPNKVKRNQGMDITFVTTAGTDDEARELLRLFGMPFAKN